jgi:hypothetical protein
VPPQGVADVVAELSVAIARVEHDPDLNEERKENKGPQCRRYLGG